MKPVLKKFIILFCISLNAFAQDKTIDSVKFALKNAKHDTIRCNVLSELAATASDNEWSLYNDQLLKLAQKGVSSNSNGSGTITNRKFYLKHLAAAYNNIGYLASNRGEISKAMYYHTKSLKISEEINDKEGIARTLNHFGYISYNRGDVSKSLDYYYQGLKIQETIKDKTGIANSLNNIANVHERFGDIPKGLEFYYKALKIQEGMNDKSGIAISLNNIAAAYCKQKNYTKALEFNDRSFKVKEEINDKDGMAYSLNIFGAIYYELSDFSKALDYYRKCLVIREEIKDKQGISNTASNISVTMLKLGKLNEAAEFANKSFVTAKELAYPESIKNAARTLKSVYEKQNKYKEAFEMYKLEIKMRDSVNNEETKKSALKKQFQYTYEKQAAQDSIKHSEEQKVKNAQLLTQEAQLKVEKTQRFVLYGGLALVIALSGFVFKRFRLTQKQKAIIAQQKVHVDLAYDKLHVKNKEVMDSINYARRIQNSLLPTEKYISKAVNRTAK